MPVVIRFGRLGDMVLQAPLLHLLRVRYGQPCRLITSGSWSGSLFDNSGEVSSVWQLRHRHMPFLLSPERWRLAIALRKCQGPIYVSEDIPRQVSRIRRLLELAGIPSGRCLFLTDESPGPKHWVDRLLRFGTMTPQACHAPYAAPLEDYWMAPRLMLNTADRQDCDAWLQRSGIHSRSVVLIQAGNKRAMKWGRARDNDAKAWPIPHWRDLLRAVHATVPHACILLCGSTAEEKLLTEIRDASQLNGIKVATRDLPLRRLLALMESAHSMISVDTGPSHMAAAVGCPLVVLYGAESREVWGRRSPNGSPIAELGGPPECGAVRDIPPDQVIAAWRTIAENRAS